MVEFVVPARCPTKGSTVSFKHKHSNKVITKQRNADKLKAFTNEVHLAARKANVEKIDGFVAMEINFYFETPKSYMNKYGVVTHKKGVTARGFGDIDKLCRTILDALTGIAYDDDSQVVAIHCEKALAAEDFVEIAIHQVRPFYDT